jgi:CheY-like chemotaxis protein
VSQSIPNAVRPLYVLHVDDDAMNRRVVEDILAAFGHRTVSVGSGAEGLEQLRAQAFDVVLMDIHMPGMSGVEAVKRLRRSAGPARHTPVIALTADIVTRRPGDYAALGFDDFVAKPILVSGLLAAIAQAVPAAKPADDRVSRTG